MPDLLFLPIDVREELADALLVERSVAVASLGEVLHDCIHFLAGIGSFDLELLVFHLQHPALSEKIFVLFDKLAAFGSLGFQQLFIHSFLLAELSLERLRAVLCCS